MSSKDRLAKFWNNAISNPVGTRRKSRRLLGRAVKSTIDALEARRMLVGNALPVADTGGPYNVNEGSSVVIDGSDSTDSDGTIVAYAWDLNYKVAKGFRRGVSGSAFTFEAEDGNATRTIALRVTDDQGGQTITTTTINIHDVDPSLTLTGDAHATEGESYTLSWSATDVGIDTITGYSVDWGDDTDATAVGANVHSASHTYAEDGTYTITLTATDEDGAHTETKTVIVDDNAPQIEAELDESTIAEGDTARVTFASPNRSGTIDQWIIDWGDGTTTVRPGRASVSTHTYNDNGDYTVLVSALEPDGTVTDRSLELTVTNIDPTVELAGVPDESPEGTAITATHTQNDVGSDTFSYAWTLKRGNSTVATSSTSGNYTFTPTDNGEYTLTLVVTDDDGGTATASKAFTVTNVSPIGAITPTLPNNFTEGDTATFSVAVTDPGSADTFEYLWSVERNGEPHSVPLNSRTASTFSFTPDDNGSYIVSVLVTDDDGGMHIALTDPFTVDNADPTAAIDRIDENNSPKEGETLSFAADVTDAGESDTFTYAWTVKIGSDTFVLPNDVATNQSSFSFIPTDNATYTIGLTVTDDDGASVVASTMDVTVANAAPVVEINVGENDNVEGSTLSFSADLSDPGSADTHTYLWSVTVGGNPLALPGVSVNDPTFHFVARDNGDYVVSLTVEDDDSDTDSATTSTITIINAAPTVSLSDEPTDAKEGDQVDVTGTATDAGLDDTLSYLWSIKRDGQSYTPAPGTTLNTANLSFTPSDNGSYVVTLVVTDSDNDATTVSSDAFNVANVAPGGAISGEPGSAIDEGDSVTLTATATDAGSDDTHTYLWHVELGGEAVTLPENLDKTSSSFTYETLDNGNYVFSVTITDDDEGTYLATSDTVVVDNVAPTASVTGGSSEDEGTAQTFTAHPADAGASDTFTYAWTVTKDGDPYALTDVTTNAATLTFTPNDDGDYVATVVVTDDDGDDVTAASATTTVTNANPVGEIVVSETGIEGTAISASLDVSDPGSADTLTYLWSVSKDGNPITLPNGYADTGATFTYTPTDEGSYELMCVVSDDDSGQNILTATVAVANAAPVPTITGLPSNVAAEGSTVVLGSSVTDPGSTDTVGSYAWTVTKDGDSYTVSNNTSSTFSFDVTDNGSYVVTLTVADNDGTSGSTTKTITVTNANPSATVTPGATTTNQGTSVGYTSSAIDPGTDDTLTYAWHVTRNGNPYSLPNNVATTSSTFTFTPMPAGSYVVTLVVSDDDEGSVSVNKNLTVNNVAPVLGSITGPSGEVTKNEAVTYSTSATDAGNDSLTYTWTISRDGHSVATLTGTEISYTPTQAGSYTVGVSVSDGSATDTDSASFSVVNHAPVISGINGVENIVEGDELSLTGTYADSDHDSLSRTWRLLRDGDLVVQSSNATFNYVYGVEGDYTIELTVSDGSESDTDSASFTVSNAAPTASYGDYTAAVEGSVFTINRVGADAGNDDVVFSTIVTLESSIDVLFSNTSESTEVGVVSPFSFTPTAPGTYVITTTANDGVADSEPVSQTIVVTNAVPNGSLTAPSNPGVIGWNQTFNVGSIVKVASDTVTVDWNWGDSSTTLGAAVGNATHRYASTGTYTVTATLKDDDGGTRALTTSFEVRDYGMQPDPFGGEGQALIVAGTSGNDVITFQKLSNGKTRAVRNGTTLGSSFNPTRIIATGEGGNDSINAGNSIVPALFYGGSGKDTLVGANGNDTLLGGKGIDSLTGGAGRDLLVGEADSDFLVGSDGEDILVGGSYAGSENFTTLATIASTWGSGSAFADRVATLRGGVFASGQVINDLKTDYLTGGGNSDWMFKDTVTGVDSILDATSADRVDNVAPVIA